VIALTDMTQDRAVVGRAARIPNVGEKGAVVSLDAVKLVPKNINQTFLYCYMRYSGIAESLKEFANGTNVLHLKPELITQQRIAIPPANLQEEFASRVMPLFLQGDTLSVANRRLRAAREFIVPRLIAGRLLVGDLGIQFPPGFPEDEGGGRDHN
jgi:type I restriction enzyme S subunit